jgi:integrase
VRHKHIHINPLDNVKPPKQHTPETDVLTPEQVRRLLDTVRGNRWECVYVLGAVCGLRVGDALALRYEDLDAFARDDDYFFGVLHSWVHELWARKKGT